MRRRRQQTATHANASFCVGSRRWDVSLDYTEGASTVTVAIEGKLRPLPLLGVTAHALGRSEGDLVVIETKVTERVRPAWLGGSYGDWQKIWG